MASTKITQLEISTSLDGSEYLIVDNTEVTRRTTINSLTSIGLFVPTATFNTLSTQYTSLSTDIWNNTYTTVQTNSATWNNASTVQITPISTTTYILALSDVGSYMRLTGDSNKVIAIPSQTVVNWPLGAMITIRNSSSIATFGLSGGVDVTLSSITSAFSPLQSTQCIYISSNLWDVL